MKRLFTINFAMLLLCISGSAQTEADAFLFLTGKVQRPDSSPPSRPIRVDFVCAEKVHQQTVTNSEGGFTFQVGGGKGQARQTMDAGIGRDIGLERSGHWNGSPDASGVFVASKFRTFKLSSCMIRVTPGQGYSGTQIQLESRSAFDDSDVGVITLKEDLRERAPTVSVTTLSAPDEAMSAFQRALDETAKPEPDLGKIAKYLEDAVEKYPEFAEAWQMLGDLHNARGEAEEAEKAYLQAFGLDDQFVKPALALARISVFREDWKSAADFSDRAASLDSSSSLAAYYSGLSHFFLGHPQEAEAGYSRLRELGQANQYPVSMLHLGMIYSRMNRPQEAANALRDYLEWMPEEHVPAGQRQQIETQLAQWKSQGIEPTPRE